MSGQMTGIMIVHNRMTDQPFTFMWDTREFSIPPGGSMPVIEPAAWHGYARSKFMFNPYTNEIDHLVGIEGIHNCEPIQDAPTELMDRKSIEEQTNKHSNHK